MKRSYSLFAGLMLVSAANAQSLPAHKGTSNGTKTSHNAIPLSHASQLSIDRKFGRLPLAFEPNQGQAGRSVRFLSHSAGGALSLASSEAVFSLPVSRPTGGNSAGGTSAGRRRGNRKVSAATLRMQLVGANPHAASLKEQPLVGRVNYFTEKDPQKWRTDIPTFGKVGFRSVYPGVDVVYYGNQQNLEYDFVVAPHADPRQIQLHFAGAQKVTVNKAGDLIVRAAGRDLAWQKPIVYQQDARGKHPVAAHFRLKHLPDGGTGVRFALGRYDTSRPLVIDPVLIYSAHMEGAFTPSTSLAVDSAGNCYVAGATYDAQNVGRTYVVKMNPTGTALLYSTYLGPTDSGFTALALDSSGNAYITGSGTPAFPTTAGAYKTQHSDSGNIFVTKLNPAGNALVYSTFVGKGMLNTGIGIALDSSGSAYITGAALDGFPTTPGAFQTSNHAPGNLNAFVTKLNPTGSDLVYSTYLGGSLDLNTNILFQEIGDAGLGIGVDSGGSAYVTGATASTDFPTTTGAFQRTNKAPVGQSSAFVTKLNPTGTALTYSTFLGGTGYNIAYALALDSNGNAYVTGTTGAADFPTTPGALRVAGSGGIFVTKLDSNGSAPVYSALVGNGGFKGGGFGIAVDGSGSAYVTGKTLSTVPTTVGAYQRGNGAAFVTKLNPTGSAQIYSTRIGGTVGDPFLTTDAGQSIGFDGSGNVYVGGSIGSMEFPVTPGAIKSGNERTFVLKLSPVNIFPDINSDGFTDLFIQNTTTGQIASWFMKGSEWNDGGYFSQTPPLDYDLIGAGAFRDTNSVTLVLQSKTTNQIAFWFTQGIGVPQNFTTISNGAFVTATPEADWKVVGIGDFNQDGKSDLVLQNQTTGQINVWYMNNYAYQGGGMLSAVPLPEWKVVGAGDFNKDGFPDLAFQNQTTGQIALWYLNGTTYTAGVLLPTLPASGWKAVAVGDYNGDGSADLLFQNQTTNQAAVWYLQNGSYAGGDMLSLTPPAGWKILGPR